MEGFNERICPFCQTEIKETDAIKVCPDCGAPHHERCWAKNQGCAYGCSLRYYNTQQAAATAVCSRCGTPLGSGQAFCPNCGTQQAAAQRVSFCSKCGNELQTDQEFCPKCGQRVGQAGDSGAGKQKKRKKKYLIPAILGVVAVAAVVAVVLFLLLRGPSVEKIELSKSYIELCINDSVSVTYAIDPEDAGDAKVTWSSSNQSVATVDATGRVLAVGEGDCTITAKAGGKSDTVLVEVFAVKSIELSESYLELNVDDTYTLTCSITPASASGVDVTWTTSDKSVATVDQNGRVCAVGAGECTITANASGKSATVLVEVKRMSKEDQRFLGSWKSVGVIGEDGEFTSVGSSFASLRIYDDYTGIMTAGETTLEFTWQFEKYDEDGDYYYSLDISSFYSLGCLVFGENGDDTAMVLIEEYALFFEQ